MSTFGQTYQEKGATSSENFQNILDPLCKKVFYKIRKFLHVQSAYFLGFSVLMFLELSVFLYMFLFSGKTLLPAFVLSCFFLSLFVFLVIRLYFLSKKNDFYEALCSEYLDQALQCTSYAGVIGEQSSISLAASKLSSVLCHSEYDLFSFAYGYFSKSLLRKISCFCFWQDYFKIREMLLERSVEAYLKVVQTIPTNLEAHVALANAYVTLSGLYADPRKYPEFDTMFWVPSKKYDGEVEEKFFSVARRAIEEFKILNEYAPGNAWVHSQLAYSYHDLQMPQEEIREYEIVLKLKPKDSETMFKLGVLYFQQGMNAAGLKIYEELKKIDYKKSQSLIKFYGIEYN
ncbi:tetratricopeptide repeat protein [Chlamydiifrater phoenicopteri]|uniref:tetratricopeptide repeat protein n=1 Tax=Chlamydiifrater phoenicopteri TaxID=2681469 RepID=UPI001BCAC2FD|nr:hypothetical protein [Chlamydiifrater phoenicopteri]